MTVEIPDKFVFFSRSANKQPGRGAGEHVSDPLKYGDLSRFRDWRKVLSNFHECVFEHRGLHYKTIEHGFQAQKIALADPEKAKLFALESDSELSKGDGLAAQKKRKMVKLNKEQLAVWEKRKHNIMGKLAVDKYLACPEAMSILKATGQAELWHAVPRQSPVRFTHLEKIRDRVQQLS